MKLENASQGISHHTGLSLATENVLQFAGLNPSSVAVSGMLLDKRPNCVKNNASQLGSGLIFRSRYLGEVLKLNLKAGTHEGACSCSTLLQHAPGAKLPRLHQRFLAKNYVAQQNFCSRVLLPHIKLVWYEGASSRGKSVARVCFRSKLPGVY